VTSCFLTKRNVQRCRGGRERGYRSFPPGIFMISSFPSETETNLPACRISLKTSSCFSLPNCWLGSRHSPRANPFDFVDQHKDGGNKQ
jgi:hypothetical protein